MTHNDLLVLLQNNEKEKSDIAGKLKEIANMDCPEHMSDAIKYLLMIYFQDKPSLRIAS